MKKTMAIILSALICVSAAACSSGGSSSSADESSKAEAQTTGAQETTAPEIDLSNMPKKLDLRNFNGKNYVTPVKCQLYGDCWTFAQAGAAEIAYLFANNMGVPAGEENDQVNFSEKYISWYVYHGITKDDVMAGRARASQVGEGFDISEAEQTNPQAVYFTGGEFTGNTTLYRLGYGPVDESVTVKGETPYSYDDSWSGHWTLPLNSEYRRPAENVYLRCNTQLPGIAQLDSDGNYSFNEEGVTAIKQELCQGHGVTFALRSNHLGFNKKRKIAYDSELSAADHAVIVVGYDDAYSKDNFTNKDKDGKVIEGTTLPATALSSSKTAGGFSILRTTQTTATSMFHTTTATLCRRLAMCLTPSRTSSPCSISTSTTCC